MQGTTVGVVSSDQAAGVSAAPRFSWPTPDRGMRYVVILGGSATLGKTVAQPFPDLIAAATGLPVLNLGIANGGPDAYLSDSGVLGLISRADAAVVQLTGAEALSNPYYSVHSRRNDRFLAATPKLQELYPEVDFTEIHFAGHLLQVLSGTDSIRFALVVNALKSTWVARMQSLLGHLPPRRILLWVSDFPPPDRAESLSSRLGPLFVDTAMLDRLRPIAGEAMIVVPGHEAPTKDGGPAPVCSLGLPDAAAHGEVASRLAPMIATLVPPPPLVLSKACLVS